MPLSSKSRAAARTLAGASIFMTRPPQGLDLGQVAVATLADRPDGARVADGLEAEGCHPGAAIRASDPLHDLDHHLRKNHAQHVIRLSLDHAAGGRTQFHVMPCRELA